eukprot:m.166209 g.166209  ORF g.166209 m.166209 type:complete len:488 (+) comp31420_c2_seq3:56-1519(+)
MSDKRAAKKAKKSKSKAETTKKVVEEQVSLGESGLWDADEPELYDDVDSEEDVKAEGEDDDDEEEEDEEASESLQAATGPTEKTFLPGDAMPENTELTFDPSAYVTYNEWNTGWPCLSFDVLGDSLGNNRQSFPMVAHLVGGTQTEDDSPCELLVMKVSNVTQIKQTVDEEDEESDDEDETPSKLQLQGIKHRGSVNRVKACPHPGSIVATWSGEGTVNIFDVSKQITALGKDQKNERLVDQKPSFTYSGHKSEGYGLAWSPVAPYRLASGDNDGVIRTWDRQSDGQWIVKPQACLGHTDSVEDIAWSPNEANVFSSCSADGTIRVWDVRSNRCAITVKAHDCDVNALSWNRCEQHLMVSGADDGSFRVWDLRTFASAAKGKAVEPVANFSWHTAPITSVEWHPTDASVISVSGEDNQVTIWDLAVEQDLEADKGGANEREVPPQLLFIHQGQQNVKEARWHKQLPGVIISTAENGFNLFKTISVTQ